MGKKSRKKKAKNDDIISDAEALLCIIFIFIVPLLGWLLGIGVGVLPLLPTLVALAVITEVIFWQGDAILSKKKNIWSATLERKAWCFLFALMAIGYYPYLAVLYANWAGVVATVQTLGYYVLITLTVIGIGFIWFYINSLKYREPPKKKRTRR